MTLNDATTAAERAATSGPDGLLDRLPGTIGKFANAQAVFGEPVVHDGVTVIPVAKVRWGFGGGGGSGRKPGSGEEGAGTGGGGGMQATPAGFIEIANGEARFVRWEDPAARWPLFIAGGIAAWMVLRGLRRLIR